MNEQTTAIPVLIQFVISRESSSKVAFLMRHLEVFDVHILTMRIVTLIEAGPRIQGANQGHKSTRLPGTLIGRSMDLRDR